VDCVCRGRGVYRWIGFLCVKGDWGRLVIQIGRIEDERGQEGWALENADGRGNGGSGSTACWRDDQGTHRVEISVSNV
jgi:hypothetical protein